MREICFTEIKGNPYIKDSNKPRTVHDFLKLSIDGEQKEAERPTKEDVEKAQEWAKTLMNGKKQQV